MTKKIRKSEGKGGALKILLVWTLRVVVYAILLVGLLVSILFAWTQSEGFDQLILNEINKQFKNSLGPGASVQSLQTDLVGSRVVLRGVKLANSKTESAFAQIDYVSFSVNIPALFGNTFIVPEVLLVNPRINLSFDEEGNPVLPEFNQVETAGQPETSDTTFRLQRLTVAGGSVALNHKALDFDIDGGDVLFSLEGMDDGTYRGRTRMRGISIRAPMIHKLKTSLSAGFELDSRQVIFHADLTADDYRLVDANGLFQFESGDLRVGAEAEFPLAGLNLGQEYQTSGILTGALEVVNKDEVLSASGWLEARDMAFNELTAKLLRVEAELKEDTLTAQILESQAFGAEMTGNIEVSALYSNPSLSGQLQTRGLSAKQLLKISGLDFLRLSSSIDSEITFSADPAAMELKQLQALITLNQRQKDLREWKRHLADAGAPGNLIPYQQAEPPLAGELKLTARDNGVVIEEGELRLTRGKYLIGGFVSADTFELQMDAVEASTRETGLALASLDRFFGLAWPEYEQLYGLSSFVASLDGKGDADLRMQLKEEEFTYTLAFDLPRVEAFGQTATEVSGALSLEGAEIALKDVTGSIAGGEVTALGTITLNAPDVPPTVPPLNEYKVDFKDIDLAVLEPFFQGEEPLDIHGNAEGSANLIYRTIDEMRGSGKISFSKVEINQAGISQAAVHFRLEDSIVIDEIHAFGADGEEFRGSGSFQTEDGHWTLDVELRPQAMEASSWFTALVPQVAGTISMDANLEGNGLVFEGGANVSIDGFRIGDTTYGDLQAGYRGKGMGGSLDLSYDGNSYSFTTDYQKAGNSATLIVKSEGQTVQLAPLLQLLTEDSSTEATLREGMELRLYLSEGNFFGAGLALGSVEAGFGGYSFAAKDVQLEYRDGYLVIHDVKLVPYLSEARELSINGSVAIDGSGQLRLDISGGVNLLALNELLDGFTISGESFADLRLRGELANPRLFGALSVAGGFIRDETSNLTLSDINGDIVFNGDRLELSGVSARAAQGSVLVEGVAQLDMAKLQPRSYKITAEALNLRFPLAEGGFARGGGVLAISGDFERTLLTGQINLDQVLYTARFDPESEVARLTAAQPLPVPDDQLRNVKLDVLIKGEDNIVIDNNFADMRVKTDVRLMGNAIEMGARGRVEVLEGDIFYRDRKYTITTGVIEFTEEHRVAPKLDFSAETQVKDYRIFLDLHGTPDRLYPELRSDPAESNLDILNLLAVGDVRDNRFVTDDERARENLLGLGVSGFLTKQFTGEIEQRAEQVLGIDRFRIDPLILDLGATPTARLTVGEQLSEDFTVIYSTNVSRDDQQVLVLEYQLSPSVLLVATREKDGSFAVDMHLKKLFR